MSDLRRHPFERPDHDADSVMGGEVGGRQLRRRHRHPIGREDETNARQTVETLHHDIGGGLRAAVLDPDIGKIGLADDRLLMHAAAGADVVRFQMSVQLQ